MKIRNKYNVYVYFDNQQVSEKEKLRKQAEFFMLLAEMKRNKEREVKNAS